VGAAADLLEDRGNGFLVPAGDAEGFARAFGELYANEGLRRSMGERSRALVASWDHDASVRGFLGAVAAARASRGARA
jgi:glycosyltransferase involved in cell wall biosynthesis